VPIIFDAAGQALTTMATDDISQLEIYGAISTITLKRKGESISLFDRKEVNEEYH
jgi:hypothetical protein